MEKDEKLREYEPDFFSYPTSRFRWPWSPKCSKIQTLAEGLKTKIETRYPQHTNIILVCHSLGGLIGRKYVLEEVKCNRKRRVLGLLLYAVPNNGAQLASVANQISWRNNQLRQLCKDSDMLRDLNEDWRKLKVDQAVQLKYVVAALDRILDEQSAQLMWGNENVEVVADRGHLDIIKPKNSNDLPFEILKNFVLSCASDPDLDIQKYATGAPRCAPMPAGQFRIIGFGLDGTLLQGYDYSWQLVWEHLKLDTNVSKAKIRAYVREYHRGELTFEKYQELCQHDCATMKHGHLNRDQFKQITKDIYPTTNLLKTLRILRNEGFVLAIISGGIDTFIEEKIPEVKELFDYICINRIHFDDQGIVSDIEPTPFDFEGKAAALEAICQANGATLANAVFVGESFNNASVIAHVTAQNGLGIAYPAQGGVIPIESQINIEEDDLDAILEHVLR